MRHRLLAAFELLLFIGAAALVVPGDEAEPEYALPTVFEVRPERSFVEPPATTAPPPTTTVDPTVSTTTVRPPAKHETFVATIRPEIEAIWPTTEPGGDYVALEFRLTNPTFFGNSLVLMVTDRTPDGEWLKVQIPVRPNGTEGWIPAREADLSSHFVRAEVNLTERSVQVWDGESLIAETAAVVGKASTPTPVGTFFVNDIVERFNGSVYGPYILSLSGFSETMETFGGGVPVIAIHGTNRPGLMGGAHSNGCIRIPNETVRFWANTVPRGTPVTIST